MEQDEYEHTKHSHYSTENELKGLVGREQFAGLRGLIIRNSCRDDESVDALQVGMIDAIITEYKAAVLTGMTLSFGSRLSFLLITEMELIILNMYLLL